jgi:hypothetical protein
MSGPIGSYDLAAGDVVTIETPRIWTPIIDIAGEDMQYHRLVSALKS